MEVGCIVKCINDSFDVDLVSRYGKGSLPKKGSLYVVSAIKKFPRGVGLYLEEVTIKIKVVYPTYKRIEQAPFFSSRFEKVLDSIELSELMINEIPEPC